jgi:hypothetical protein
MQPNCIFCNAPTDSEEHVFPKWLMKRYPQPGVLERQRSIDDTAMSIRSKTPFKLTVRCVCQKCNNGWMSVLQTAAKPVIERLLDNPACTLDLYDGKALTLWAVMSAMVLEAVNEPAAWRFSEPERFFISDGRNQISDLTRVWIAKWVDSPGLSYTCHLLSRAGDSASAASATFGFGTLAFQILKVAPDGKPFLSMACRLGPWGDALLEIWPLKGEPFSWPPHAAIEGDAGMEALDMRFSPPGARSA